MGEIARPLSRLSQLDIAERSETGDPLTIDFVHNTRLGNVFAGSATHQKIRETWRPVFGISKTMRHLSRYASSRRRNDISRNMLASMNYDMFSCDVVVCYQSQDSMACQQCITMAKGARRSFRGWP